MVMCRMLLEVGDYASTILDKAHQMYSRKCLAINKKIEKELIKRKAVQSLDEVYDAPSDTIDSSDLSVLSINQLETLYRQWQLRFNERLRERRQTLTRFFETRIVKEMKSRKNITAAEQLRIVYCDRTNRDELHNISAIIELPLGNAYLDISRCHTPQEILAIINSLRRYKTVAEREMLIETVEKAIDFIDHNRDLNIAVNLAAEVVELNDCEVVSCPKWIKDYLLEKVKRWKKQPLDFDRDKIIPYLSIWISDKSARWRAVRILNTCYSNCLVSDASTNISELLEDMYLVEQCCTFVTRYNVRKLAAVWNRCCDRIAATCGLKALSTTQITKLLFVANSIVDYAPISPAHRKALSSILADRAIAGDFEAEIYVHTHSLKPY